jgi:outer membrane lipase/esterase
MKVASIVLVIGVALVSFAQSAAAQRAAAQSFSQVIVFGDSNVDSGYYKLLSNPGGGTTYNTDWPIAVAHGAGAPTTNPGLMSPQFLAAFMNLTANPANTSGGTNYATSGAKNEIPNSIANGGFTAAIPTGTQIRNYVSAHGGVADSQALYLIWSGDNDVSYANGDTGTSPPPNPNSYVMEAAEDLNGDILILHNAGAQHIIVAGLAYSYPTGNSTDAVNHRALKLLYTQTLFQNLTQIGVPHYQADINSVRLAISANPSFYGFTNVGTGAGQMGCTQPSGVPSAWALLCSSDPSAPSTLVSPTSPSTDLFADNEHLGTAGQKLMANYLYQLVAPLAATAITGPAPFVVTFSSLGLAPTTPYTVNFGDGTFGPLTLGTCIGVSAVVGGQGGLRCPGSASHTYSTPGSYPATLVDASKKTLGIATITVTAGSAARNSVVHWSRVPGR